LVQAPDCPGHWQLAANAEVHHEAVLGLLSEISDPLRKCCLPLFGQSTGLNRVRRVNRVGALVDVTNDAVFIDYKGDAIGEKTGEIESAVRLGYLPVGVAEQRESRAGLLREPTISFLVVKTNPYHLRAFGFEFGDITLIRPNLLRSTGSRCANVKRQDHRLLAKEVSEFHGLSVLIRQLKIRGVVANLQSRRCT
jgi:hypothetical protein